MTPQGLDMLKRHEGFRESPYLDSRGITTIGYGINLEAHPELYKDALPKPPSPAKGNALCQALLGVGFTISEADATVWMEKHLLDIIPSLLELAPWYPDMTLTRQDVLENMAYNMGVPNLRSFQNTLHHMSVGNYAKAADNMLVSRWRSQVGRRALELAELMRHG